MKNVKFLVGMEDRVYQRWQLSIFLESLLGKLPPGWEPWVVVCNDHHELSSDLKRVLDLYCIRSFTAADKPHSEKMDFAAGDDVYVPINRIEALNVVADHVQETDLVCLTETDIFLYKDLDTTVFPHGNAVFDNWLVRQDIFFSNGGRHETTGVRLPKLLEAMGCETPFQPGGVTVFLDAETMHNRKFIQDCFRFTQVLYLLGTIVGVPKIWTAEMPAFALALTANGIDYELIDQPQFTTQNHDHRTIPEGTFYHYYHDLRDGGDGAFYDSAWYKHQFMFQNPLRRTLTPHREKASTDHEKYFFQLAERAQRRIWRFEAPSAIQQQTAERQRQVPYFGLGFRKTKVDPTLHQLLMRRLESNADKLQNEADDVSEYILNIDASAVTTQLQPDAEFNRSLLIALKAEHEQWCGFPLEQSACYGIRVYRSGTYLYEHTDTPDTHIISSTICIHCELDEPWPLTLEDIEGRSHDVCLEAGEMLFYEGARLKHGRPYPLRGSYYAGIYLHYRPMEDGGDAKRK